jgi:putative transcriptional regulator
MEDRLVLLNRLKDARNESKISQSALADMVGVSRNTISSIETGQYSPTAKLAYSLCIALDKKFEEIFYFDACPVPRAERDTRDRCEENSETDSGSTTFSSRSLQRLMEYLTGEGWDASKILDFISFIAK